MSTSTLDVYQQMIAEADLLVLEKEAQFEKDRELYLPVRVPRRTVDVDVGENLPAKAPGRLLTPTITVPNIIRRKGGKKGEEIKYGPKQIPIEEQAGVYLDRSVMEELERDPLGRDVFSKDERLREWDETEELYHKHKDAPIPIDPNFTHLGEFGIYLNGGDMGQGKSQKKGTPILMYDGNIKLVEDVKAGDLLMGPDSKPRTVLAAHSGWSPLYDIIPVKGETWGCNDVHILTLVKTNVTKRGKLSPTSGEIIDVPLNEWQQWGRKKKSWYKLFRVGVDFPWQPKEDLLVEPYFLGLLLGDGMMTTRNIQVSVANTDPEIDSYCDEIATVWGCGLRKIPHHKSDAMHQYHFNVGVGKNGLKLYRALENIGVHDHRAHDKFIPQIYKTASKEDRLEVIAGLIDSDGHLEQGIYDFTSKSSALANDLAFIARSVGLAAYVSPKDVKWHDGRILNYWRVTISGNIDMIPCKLPRKQAPPRLQKKDVLRTGFKVEPIGEGEYFGFVLDGDGRYLLGDFTVTHNTLWASFVARHYRRRGWNVYSTAGLLFGQRLRLAESYAFPDHVTPGGFIFADEVHTLVDRYSSNSVRSRTFGQSSTAMRKERIGCMGASAHTIMVGFEFKGVTERVMVPRRWYPGGKLHAPPFCYIEIVMLHPFPYRRKDQLLMDAGLVRGADDIKKARWRPAPQELMAAAKLMDSFESVKIGENFGIGAKEMQAEREGRGGETGGASSGQSGGKPNLVWVIKRVHEAGYIREDSKVYFTTIRDILSQAGLTVSTTQIRSALEMVGCPVASSTVNESDLRELFLNIDSERA